MKQQRAVSTWTLLLFGISMLVSATRADKTMLPGICYKPKSIGRPCPGMEDDIHLRWYYNDTAQYCFAFGYAGCGGNENNFASLIDCKRDCYPKITAGTANARSKVIGDIEEDHPHPCAPSLIPVPEPVDKPEVCQPNEAVRSYITFFRGYVCCDKEAEDVYLKMSGTCDDDTVPLITRSEEHNTTLLGDSCRDLPCPANFRCVERSIFAKCCRVSPRARLKQNPSLKKIKDKGLMMDPEDNSDSDSDSDDAELEEFQSERPRDSSETGSNQFSDDQDNDEGGSSDFVEAPTANPRFQSRERRTTNNPIKAGNNKKTEEEEYYDDYVDDGLRPTDAKSTTVNHNRRHGKRTTQAASQDLEQVSHEDEADDALYHESIEKGPFQVASGRQKPSDSSKKQNRPKKTHKHRSESSESEETESERTKLTQASATATVTTESSSSAVTTTTSTSTTTSTLTTTTTQTTTTSTSTSTTSSTSTTTMGSSSSTKSSPSTRKSAPKQVHESAEKETDSFSARFSSGKTGSKKTGSDSGSGLAMHNKELVLGSEEEYDLSAEADVDSKPNAAQLKKIRTTIGVRLRDPDEYEYDEGNRTWRKKTRQQE